MSKLLETQGNVNPVKFKLTIQYELLKDDGKASVFVGPNRRFMCTKWISMAVTNLPISTLANWVLCVNVGVISVFFSQFGLVWLRFGFSMTERSTCYMYLFVPLVFHDSLPTRNTINNPKHRDETNAFPPLWLSNPLQFLIERKLSLSLSLPGS